MDEDEELNELLGQLLRNVLDDVETKVRRCVELRDATEADPTHTQRCVIGGEKVFFQPDDMARIPGHIYSDQGVREYLISHLCEFHFDEITREPE